MFIEMSRAGTWVERKGKVNMRGKISSMKHGKREKVGKGETGEGKGGKVENVKGNVESECGK